MFPVIIPKFGFLPALHTYGLMIALGFYVGMQLGAREARRVDLSPEKNFDKFILDLIFWILIVSLAGSRILYIIVNWEDDYSKNPIKVFEFWKGGLVFYGGFISAVLFSAWYSKKHNRDFFQVSDILIPSVALGHCFGRLGCLAAGCCWGDVVDSAFALGIQFPKGALIHGSQAAHGLIAHSDPYTLHVHPVQLYESAGELLIFFILILSRGRKRFHGQLLLTYLFLYPVLRTGLEFFRGDSERGVTNVFGLPMSTGQIVSVLVAMGAISLLIYLRGRMPGVVAANQPPEEPPAAPA